MDDIKGYKTGTSGSAVNGELGATTGAFSASVHCESTYKAVDNVLDRC